MEYLDDGDGTAEQRSVLQVRVRDPHVCALLPSSLASFHASVIACSPL